MVWQYIKKVAIIIGMISGFIAIIDRIWGIAFLNTKNLFVESVYENVISFGSKEGALSVFYYDDEVFNVWKLQVNIENTGNSTIYGSGPSSVILNDTLVIEVDSFFKIINHDVYYNDIDADFSWSSNTVSIVFKKWNPDEIIQIELMLSTDYNNIPPEISVNERNFIGAGIQCKNSGQSNNITSSQSLIWLSRIRSIIPSFLISISRILTIFFSGLIFVAALYLLIVVPYKFIIFRIWVPKHYKTYLKELDQVEIPDDEKKEYKRQPWKIPKKYKNKFTSLPKTGPDDEDIGVDIFTYTLMPFLGISALIVFLFAWNNL